MVVRMKLRVCMDKMAGYRGDRKMWIVCGLQPVRAACYLLACGCTKRAITGAPPSIAVAPCGRTRGVHRSPLTEKGHYFCSDS